MRALHTLARPTAFVVVAALFAACGGAASPSPAASVAPSQAAAVTPSPTVAPSATATSSSSGPDISGAAKALANLTAYQLDVSVEGAIIPGASGTSQTVNVKAVVDRKNKASEFTIGGMSGVPANGLKVIVVGQDAWVDLTGTGNYIKQPGGASTFGATLDSFDPAKLMTSIPTAALAFVAKVGDEQKNGVQTSHYHIDAKATPQLAENLGPNGVVDFWIATDGGYLVSMTADGEVTNNGTKMPMKMSIDISRLNDPAINIQPPG
jgi:hypothetical protein